VNPSLVGRFRLSGGAFRWGDIPGRWRMKDRHHLSRR
jgi:hypothetical protein